MIADGNNLIGKILGDYVLKELIGQGGNALVFRAWQGNLTRDVAVKVLRLQEFASTNLHNNFLIRFQQEASVIAAFDHVNIMPIYGFGQYDGLAYLVMPLLRKGSLRNMLQKRGSLPLQEALTYVSQAASALDYAHARKVIHRDLKPANFLIHDDGRLILTDFGIAHLMKESMAGLTLTSTGMLLGTPEYMAPEMIEPALLQGQHVDHRADIYELGIVLYEMLSGSLPFRDENMYTVLLKQLHEPFPLLHPLHSAIPSGVDDVLQKATAKNRDERFSSAGDLAQALQEAISPALPMPGAPSHAPTGLPLHIPSHPMQTVYSVDVQSAFNAVPKVPLAPTVIVSTPQAPTVVAPSPFLSSATASKKTQRSSLKRSSLWFMLILFICIGMIGVSLIRISTAMQGSGASNVPYSPSPIATSTPTPTYDAQKAVVVDFYRALNLRDYSTAYKYYVNDGETSANSKAYCAFVEGYAAMIGNSIQIDAATPLNDGTNAVQIDITITATEAGPQGETRISVYQQFQVVQDGKIVRGGDRNSNINGLVGTPTITTGPQLLTTPDPGHTSLLQVQEVVQEEYDDINRKDYRTAYSLWSSAYQSTTTFCSFLLSNVRPQHVTIGVGNTDYQDNGMYSVPVTLTETIAGTQTSPYNKTYIVASLSDGTWRIMQAV